MLNRDPDLSVPGIFSVLAKCDSIGLQTAAAVENRVDAALARGVRKVGAFSDGAGDVGGTALGQVQGSGQA